MKNNEKGGAVVETAILMIILVPLILYTFFVSELMYQVLNAQEPVISAVWDYTTAPFDIHEKFWGITDDNGVNTYNRVEYADHTSAHLNLENDNFKDQKMHWHPWVELTWTSKKETRYSDSSYYNQKSTAHQIACDKVGDASELSTGTLIGFSGSAGRIVCWIKGEVHNFLIPKFFSPTGRVNEERDQLISSRVEGSKGINNGDINVYDSYGSGWISIKNRASILTGDWSTLEDHYGKPSNHKDISVHEGYDFVPQFMAENSVFYKRSLKYHALAIALATPKILSYFNKLNSEKIATMAGSIFINPEYFYMSAKFSHTAEDFNNKGETSYLHSVLTSFSEPEFITLSNRDYLRKAKNVRGGYYLGNKQKIGQ